MTTDYTGALDEIFARFLTDWKANSAAIVGYIPEVRWQDQSEPDKPAKDKYWCRCSVNTVATEQSTLSTYVTAPFKKRYYTEGFAYIQIFAPKSDAKAKQLINQLALIGQKAFRKTSPSVCYLNATIKEIPAEEQWIRRNVMTEFSYGEIG